MTSIITETTRDFLTSESYEATSSIVHLISTLLLFLVLIYRELIRVAGGGECEENLRASAVVAVPLLFAYAMILVNRFAQFVQ